MGAENLRIKAVGIRKDALWITAGSFAYSLSQWLFTVVATRLAGYEAAGMYSLVLAISQAIIGFGLYGMRPFQVTDIKYEYSDGEYVASRVLTCAAMIPICAIFIWANRYDHTTILLIIIYTVFRTIEAFIEIYYGIAQRAERLYYTGISYLIRSVLSIFAFTIILWFTNDILLACTSLLFVALCVMFFYDIPYVKRLGQIKPAFHMDKVLPLLWRCFPLAVFGFLTNYIINIPRYDLERIVSKEALGIFSAIFMPAFVITLLSGLVLQPIATRLAYRLEQNDIRGFIRLIVLPCSITLVFAAGCIVGSLLFGGTFLTLLYSKPLQAYAFPFTIILVGVAISALVQILSTVLTTARIIYPQMIALAISLGFAFVVSTYMIQINGLIGAAYAYLAIMLVQLVGYGVLLTALVFKMKRHNALATMP